MRDRIKAVLDDDCLNRNEGCECFDLVNQDENGIYHGAKPRCSKCLRHTSLADRIADLVPAEVKK